jgi:hypothetical protein
MRRTKYALTAEQFQVLREKLEQRNGNERFDDDNVKVAYSVMVDGVPVNEAAEKSGCSRQNLHRIVRDLQAIFLGIEPPSRAKQRKKQETPKDWVKVSVTLPPQLAKSVQELEIKARQDLKESQNSKKG